MSGDEETFANHFVEELRLGCRGYYAAPNHLSRERIKSLCAEKIDADPELRGRVALWVVNFASDSEDPYFPNSHYFKLHNLFQK